MTREVDVVAAGAVSVVETAAIAAAFVAAMSMTKSFEAGDETAMFDCWWRRKGKERRHHHHRRRRRHLCSRVSETEIVDCRRDVAAVVAAQHPPW